MKLKQMKLRIWTEAYTPFAMGGVNAPISTEVVVGEKLDLGKGYFGFLVASPITGQTFIAESKTGAIVGSTLREVRDDIKAAKPSVMADQIKEAKERVKKARGLSPDAFWKRMG